MDAGHNCMIARNSSKAAPCNTTFAQFIGDNVDIGFGPTPSGGMTISGLFARSKIAQAGSGSTVDVITVNSADVNTVVLTCTVTAGNTTCTIAGPAAIPGDVYLQVRVTRNAGTSAATPWRAIFLY
jgi:hypothetical protein